MGNIDVIVVGCSAGGVTALQELVAALPADFETPVFIVQHIGAYKPSYLAAILDRCGPLKALHPVSGTKIQKGHIYIAPPDYHMLIENSHILVKRGPKENRFRPSIDALFRSAAYTYGQGVIGLILTGMLDDGTSGMWSVKRMGGIAIVQDPDEAAYPSMPESVLQFVDADHICPLNQISRLLVELTQKTMEPKPDTDPQQVRLLKMEVDIAALGNAFDKGIVQMGEPSNLTCPECGGALTTLTEGNIVRYRCHTGHAYSPSSLLEEVKETAEHKLWAALRSLEEAVMIVEKNAAVSAQNGQDQTAMDYPEKIRVLKSRADELRSFINHYLESANLAADQIDR